MAENYGSELDKIQNWQTFLKDANTDLENIKTFNFFSSRCSPEVESRTQGSRPRTQKKIRGQGQGQPFREQTLSWPRTGMLEAKAKDQEHSRKCSPKKKVFKKVFQAISNL